MTVGTVKPRAHLRARVSMLLAVTLGVTLGPALGVGYAATAARSPGMSPIAARDTAHVTADALPTAQIDGVVWSQVIVDDVVYAAGEFTTARPAGSPAESDTVTRHNLVAYNIRTGVLTPFAPVVNAPIFSVVASPDGRRLYIGGAFTRVNNKARNRIAAFNIADGSLVTSFSPHLDASVRTLVATNSTVYAGGQFTRATGAVRGRVAAFAASNGAVTSWNPDANNQVLAMALTTDGSKIVLGGRFTTLGGRSTYGMAAVHPSTGAQVSWAATSLIRNAGQNAAINSLVADGDQIYGTGYVYGKGGNFEGTFSASQRDGSITWIEDCHGDTYDAAPIGGHIYTVGHAHYCGNIGGFPETNPRSWQRALSFTRTTTGTIGREHLGYHNFEGNPSPSLVNWFPAFNTGTHTGQGQGPWTIAATDEYVVMGGEFTTVNGRGQQGLVRFAIPSQAPNEQGPRLNGADLPVTATEIAPGIVRVALPANWDRDDLELTYRLLRNGNSTPAAVRRVESTFWDRPRIAFLDTGRPAGTTSYRVEVADDDGNVVRSETVSVTAYAGGSVSPYAREVIEDGAANYWRLGESAGGTAFNWTSDDDLTAGNALIRGGEGAISGDTDPASSFDGTPASRSASSIATPAPRTFSIEAWFKTSSTSGGKIVGFGNSATGDSTTVDRHLYLQPDGRVSFGMQTKTRQILTSATPLNDGAWHHAVASYGPDGMTLTIDGARVGTRPFEYVAAPLGFWRIGGDSTWSGAPDFTGSIDEVAIYPHVLSSEQIRDHYSLSGRTPPPPGEPEEPEQPEVVTYATDAFGRTASRGWGKADIGGSWSHIGKASTFSVAKGKASLRLGAKGPGPTAALARAGVLDVDARVDVSLSTKPRRGGTSVALAARHSGAGDYRAQVTFSPKGASLALLERRKKNMTRLGSVKLSRLTYKSGQTYRVRLLITGGATPQLQAKVWRVGTREPSAWQLTRTDTTKALTSTGGLALTGSLDKTSRAAPTTLRFDNLLARRP